MDRKNIIIGILSVLLVIASICALMGWKSDSNRVEELEARLDTLRRQEQRSAVLRSVSSQMEEIAYQQKTISDEQRLEAIEQTKYANEMRERSEIERQNAIIAQNNALESEHKALEAFDLAEKQREMAEHQRIQAEFSKRVADTLSYIALGRSLGSLSMTQYQTGNDELANMLSYAACLYTERYNGDLHYPAVFSSLMQTSQSKNIWSEHHGAVTCLDFIQGNENMMVTASDFGEIMIHQKIGDRMRSSLIFNDKHYDFRFLVVTQLGDILAVSRTGHLVIIKNLKAKTIMPMEMVNHPNRIDMVNNGEFYLVSGENSLALLDGKTYKVISFRDLDFKIISASRVDYKPLLFDDRGRMHIVESIDKFTTKKIPVQGKVTSYASSKSSKLQAYGMNDGTIYLIDKNGKITRLQGHRSRISKMKINNTDLYSSSYDGKLNLWVSTNEKVEPMTLFSTGSWIYTFTFDNSKNSVWTGDQRGNITEATISVPLMKERLQKKIKRNFTTDEWNYYIGQNVPYEQFIKGKEAKQ